MVNFFFEELKKIKNMADIGLLYSNNDFDKERYEDLKEISLNMMSILSGTQLQNLKDFYLPVQDYPTPKIDVRGVVLNEHKEILLVKEQQDTGWSIPGGWADVGYSPGEMALKELKEESGLVCRIIRLLAVYDKKCHNHPPQPHYVYKLLYHCEVVSGKLESGFDMEDSGFFPITDLPPLSNDRILKEQILQLLDLIDTGGVYSD